MPPRRCAPARAWSSARGAGRRGGGAVGRGRDSHRAPRQQHLPLGERFCRSSRPALFGVLEVLVLRSASADTSCWPRSGSCAPAGAGGVIHPAHQDGKEIDLSFAPEAWRKIINGLRGRAGGPPALRGVRVLLPGGRAAPGDIAVAGSESYAIRRPASELGGMRALIGGYCAEAGLPAGAAEATAALRAQLEEVAVRVDAGYPHDTDLVIDQGLPVLRRRRGPERRASALALEAARPSGCPSAASGLLAPTATHRLAPALRPASGSDPKIRDTLGRYALADFCQGANLVPAQVARHMRDRLALRAGHGEQARRQQEDPRRLRGRDQRVRPAGPVRLCGNGSRAGADGTQIDTWAGNLLAETSIRSEDTEASRTG